MTQPSPLSRYFIGMMSGTSLDGVDAVLVQSNALGVKQIAHAFLAYPAALKQQLLTLHVAGHDELHLTAIAANQLADLYAQTVPSLLQQSGLQAHQITAIACHGQTIRHCPNTNEAQAYTIQIGNHARLAERTNITVIGDFRSRDIAAGGQGAPLVPAFHQAVFADPHHQRTIINIGGIANISWLPHTGEVIGFDSGPGNMLLDSWTEHHTGKAYDQAGAWSATGNVHPSLLEAMTKDAYFQLGIPKSTGRDYFHMAWLTQHVSTFALPPEDVARTLLELTAITITEAVSRYCVGVDDIYLCGGGAHNHVLVQRIRALSPCPVHLTDALGIGVDWVEAVAFAWLAQRCIDGQPGNLAAVTGARGPRILGAIYPA